MRKVEGDVGRSDPPDPGRHGEGADGRVPDVGRVDLRRVHVDHGEAARGKELADEGEGGPDGPLLQEPGHDAAGAGEEEAPGDRHGQGSGKLLRPLKILVDKSKSRGQFWSETTRKASGQIVSGQ